MNNALAPEGGELARSRCSQQYIRGTRVGALCAKKWQGSETFREHSWTFLALEILETSFRYRELSLQHALHFEDYFRIVQQFFWVDSLRYSLTPPFD